MVNLRTHGKYFRIRWRIRIPTLMLEPMRIVLTIGKLTSIFLFESVKGPNGLNFYV